MKEPAWHAHPVRPECRAYGCLLEIGDVLAKGDLCDPDHGWQPTQLAGVPISRFTRTMYVRPTKKP